MLRAWSFDYYYSLPFWGVLVAVACLVRAGGRTVAARGWVLLAASNALLLAIPHFGWFELGLVWLVSAAAFASARGLAGSSERTPRRRALAVAGVVAVLAVLAFFKYHFLQDLLLGRLAPPRAEGARGVGAYLVLIGASYFTFKAIHVIVETYRGVITGVEALTFFNYMTFFPAFISGPINRYADFAGQLHGGAPALGEDLRAGGERIVHGLFKKFVLVPIVFPYVLTNLPKPLAQATALESMVGLYAYALYFYFDFAGYSDLAIGGARLIGIRLPENFDRPFFQKNIRDLWSAWHMSLTTWLVDYVYWPVVRALRNYEFFRTRPVLLSIVGMNVTFIGCGIWHGEAPHFVLWGAYHGLGISALNLYQRRKKRIRNPAVQRWFGSRWSHWAGAFATFNFFAVGLALFVLDLDKLGALVAALFRVRAG
jgi:alginate O-acetyltransferase complex protein AlgI